MIAHPQFTRKETIFYEPFVTESAGVITCPAGNVWVRGIAYPLPAYSPTVGTSLFRLHVEQTATGVDYVLDLTLFNVPKPIRDVGALPVAWREIVGDDVHVLRQVDV